VCTASRRILGRIIVGQSQVALEIVDKVLGRIVLSSATQFAFLRDPEQRSSASTRSLKKERERQPSSFARAPL
jgi:hypothetical protein